MAEEAIPPFEDNNATRINGRLIRCAGPGGAGNAMTPSRERDEKPNDTTDDTREREASEAKEQEGGTRARTGSGERERQEGEHSPKMQCCCRYLSR